MLRKNIALAALETGDDAETRAVLAQARRFLEAGDREQALQCLKRGVDSAWAVQKDRRALRLAAAAAELRETGELAMDRPGLTSSVMAVAPPPPLALPALPVTAITEPRRAADPVDAATDGEPIDVEAGWLEPPEAEKAAVDRRAIAPAGGAAKASLGEAVRVWVGPNGELSLYVPGTRPRRGHVEALLVTTVTTARLAERIPRPRE